jgi:hypothetical protein
MCGKRPSRAEDGRVFSQLPAVFGRKSPTVVALNFSSGMGKSVAADALFSPRNCPDYEVKNDCDHPSFGGTHRGDDSADLLQREEDGEIEKSTRDLGKVVGQRQDMRMKLR